MENTVTITLAEWQRLDGLDRQFDEKLKAAVKDRIDSERAFVLRDRDEYVRRNEQLRDENRKLQDSVAKATEANVKLRLDLDKAERRIADLEGAIKIATAAVDVTKEKIKKYDETETKLRATIDVLHKEVGELVTDLDRLRGRGLFARIFDWR